MTTETLLHQAVRGALAVGAAGGLVGAGAALAQTAAPAAGTATNLSKIIVTGSHIPQTAIATAQPVVTISRQQIQDTGFTSVGQILQSITSAGSALNENFNNGGTGAEFVNLHDLGPKRVLVLVNGQRWVSQLNGAVDLTSIPASVIQRVDVLLDGASAVYGSDAIAGVINIITIKNFNGAEADAYLGMYDGSSDGGGWDGKTQQYSFTVGTSGDRSAVLLSAGYYKQNSVWAGQRTISKEPYFGCGQLCGSSNGSVGRYWMALSPAPNIPGCSAQAFGVLDPDHPVPGCDLAGPVVSANGVTANPHPYTVADNYNYAPTGYLRTPSERWYLYSQGHYDLTQDITFQFTTTYNRRNSNQTLAQNPWALGAAGYTANGLPIGVSANNPYNPFGVDLVPTLGQSPSVTDAWCSKFGSGGGANGCTANTGKLFLLGWRPLAAPLRVFSQNVTTFYFNGGFRGYWQMFGNQWTWNANYIYGNKSNTTITEGLASTAELQKHLGPNCTGTTPTASCVALNMFSGAAGQTKAQIAPLLFTAHSVTSQTLRDYNAGIGGNFFNGWYAGPWGLALGYEYTEMDGFFSPDAFIAAGNTVGNPAKPTNGRENTNAQYAELTIPFAHDLPFAKEITLDLANRWSQFHWNGQGNVYNLQTRQVSVVNVDNRATASTGRATLKWRPVSQLLLRGAWSQGFRIPSISELFGGIVGNFPGLSDPCAPPPFGGHSGGPLPPGCHGVAHAQPSGQVQTVVGGNPYVQPEKSISRSVGFVYSPKWAPGLNFSADYFKVEVDGLIGSPGIQFYVNQCYLSSNPGDACKHLFLSGNVITRAVALNINGGSKTVEGIDGDFNYKLPVTPVGQFGVGLGFTFIKSDVYCDTSGNCTQGAGTAGKYTGGGAAGGAATGSFTAEPRHRYNLSLDWDYGPWSAAYRMFVIGGVWENCARGTGKNVNGQIVEVCSNPEKRNGPNDTGTPTGQNHLGTTVYSDIQASYTLSAWNTTFTLGVNNVFDKSPPIARTAFANSFYPMYRIPGRFWYGRVSVKF
ncbi:MAG: TonB-dependent receptor plug domain-containing protein [Gammaproteobacteria bacterium]